MTCVAERVHSALVLDNITSLREHDVVGEVLPYMLILAGSAVAMIGHLVVRPVFALIAFASGALGALQLIYGTTELADGWSCESVVASVLGVAGVCAVLGATILRLLVTLLAAATGVVCVLLLMDVCEVCAAPPWPGAPVLWDKPVVAYWVSIVVAAGAGALAARYRRTHVFIAVTSVAGGLAAATGVRVLLEQYDGTTPPQWATVSTTLGVSGVGAIVQYWLRTRRAERRPEA
jgi:hypothetical protein